VHVRGTGHTLVLGNRSPAQIARPSDLIEFSLTPFYVAIPVPDEIVGPMRLVIFPPAMGVNLRGSRIPCRGLGGCDKSAFVEHGFLERLASPR
jgi:hypothetical protein